MIKSEPVLAKTVGVWLWLPYKPDNQAKTNYTQTLDIDLLGAPQRLISTYGICEMCINNKNLLDWCVGEFVLTIWGQGSHVYNHLIWVVWAPGWPTTGLVQHCMTEQTYPASPPGVFAAPLCSMDTLASWAVLHKSTLANRPSQRWPFFSPSCFSAIRCPSRTSLALRCTAVQS